MSPRIVTLTLNPCLDLAAEAEHVWPTHKVRTEHEHTDAGGGGVNVSRVLLALGAETLAVMASGGAPGRVLEELLIECGLAYQPVPLAGRTRISLNVQDRASGLEYRFVPEGPTMSKPEWQAVLDTVSEVEADWLVASGSLPMGAPKDAYAQIADIAAWRGQRFALDTHGSALRAALHHGIALLKPSINELEWLVGRKLPDEHMQDAEAMSLVRSGAAEMVAVSLGEDGALLATSEGVLRMAAPRIRVQTAVGAGDSFLAGLALELARGNSAKEALRWGMAAGAAAVICSGASKVTRAAVEERYRALVVEPCDGSSIPEPAMACAAAGVTESPVRRPW